MDRFTSDFLGARETALMRPHQISSRILIHGLLLSTCAAASGQLPEPAPDPESKHPADHGSLRAPLAPLPESLSKVIEKATPLNPEQTVFLNGSKKRIYLHTEVSCRNCVLEMLCVPIGQREHETILNVRARAFVVHAGLLALGLKPGKPAVFHPEFSPPKGPVLTMRVHWADETAKLQSADPRSWIRHSVHRYFSQPLASAPPGVKLPHEELRYDPYNKEILWYGPMTTKQREHLLTLWDDPDYQAAIGTFHQESQSRAMEANFVFTGSQLYTDEQTGQRRYAAEHGHFITVANFPSSTIDVAEASSASEGGEMYEAWEQRIPPEGTPVILEIGPAAQPKNPAARDIPGQ